MTKAPSARALLLQMPFGALERPSLALSLLKACLEEGGFACDVRYLNLDFAAFTGPELYRRLSDQLPAEMLVGELVFSAAVFGDWPAYASPAQVARRAAAQTLLPTDLAAALPWLGRLAERFLQQTLARVPWQLYRLVGFASMFQQVVPSLALARRLKHLPRPLPVIFGGPNCEGEMGLALHRLFPWVDFVCRGEGERLIVELMRHLEEDDGEPAAIAGLVWRRDGESVANPPASPVDLDRLPIPAYSDWLRQASRPELRLDPQQRVLPLETSRGCWYGARAHCTFCGLNGTTLAFRSKSPGRAKSEIEALQPYRIRNVQAVDNILDFRYFASVLPELARMEHGLEIFYEVKANLDRRHLELLHAAGVRKLQPGIESLSTAVLQRMRKGVTALQNVRLLRDCAELGLDLAWNLLYGFAGEDAAEYLAMAELVPALVHLPAPAGRCTRVRLDRFSPMFERPGEHGVGRIRPARFYPAVFPLAEEDLQQLAYYFEDEAAEECPAYVVPLLAAVERWTARAGRATFTAQDDGEVTCLVDTRPGASEHQTIVTGAAREIFRACAGGITRSQLQRRLALSAEVVDQELSDQTARRWLVELDGSFLNLAVNAGLMNQSTGKDAGSD